MALAVAAAGAACLAVSSSAPTKAKCVESGFGSRSDRFSRQRPSLKVEEALPTSASGEYAERKCLQRPDDSFFSRREVASYFVRAAISIILPLPYWTTTRLDAVAALEDQTLIRVFRGDGEERPTDPYSILVPQDWKRLPVSLNDAKLYGLDTAYSGSEGLLEVSILPVASCTSCR
eukprot:TRINITY_DN114_c0_g1_i2.p1 TRINITY_DN114_c0_g1~~TRINITY_DN114_c0_g1_i2.p1  ORF type:complete len:176 (-),score=19.31 TRINITY_DN114_c0_g1_i2:211-738(-)